MSKNSRLVYSTDQGRIDTDQLSTPLPKGDGIIRIQRETKGRGGKAVTVITGVPGDQLKEICKLLKARCASGGAVKQYSIEIQGEHRERIKELLSSRGYQVKLAGG